MLGRFRIQRGHVVAKRPLRAEMWTDIGPESMEWRDRCVRSEHMPNPRERRFAARCAFVRPRHRRGWISSLWCAEKASVHGTPSVAGPSPFKKLGHRRAGSSRLANVAMGKTCAARSGARVRPRVAGHESNRCEFDGPRTPRMPRVDSRQHLYEEEPSPHEQATSHKDSDERWCTIGSLWRPRLLRSDLWKRQKGCARLGLGIGGLLYNECGGRDQPRRSTTAVNPSGELAEDRFFVRGSQSSVAASASHSGVAALIRSASQVLARPNQLWRASPSLAPDSLRQLAPTARALRVWH